MFGRRNKGPRADRIEPASTPQVQIYKAGDVIGGDFLVRRVMEGGLGVVYVVEHREAKGARCVLKTSKRQSDAIVRESFRTEAEIWVRLGDHPNIVPAWFVSEFVGKLFVIAPFVKGDELNRVSLRDYLRSGPLRPDTIAKWTADFCRGLEYARSKGLIAHRDIKPENLLIGAVGSLRITDFGIARAMAHGLSDTPNAPLDKLGEWQTHAGRVSGTPPYMAPEQWLGTKQDIRTDIYAFGVVMYEMCYGHLPFTGASIQALMAQHLRTEPKIPVSMFAQIVARCLSKQPAERYVGPMALLDDITRICRAKGIALPSTPIAVGQKEDELAMLASGLGAVGKHQEAVNAARELVARAPEDAQHWGALGSLLEKSGDIAGALAAFDRSLDLDETQWFVWNNLGLLLSRLQKWQEALVALERALHYDPINTKVIINCARPLLELGRAREAIELLKRAVALAPDEWVIWNNLGAAYNKLGDKQNALDCLLKGRALAPDRHHGQIDIDIKTVRALRA
jgi:serine/threonine protein kinase